MTPNIRCLALHLNRGRGATAEVNGTLSSIKMTRCALYKYLWVVQTATGYHPRPVTPSRTDGSLFEAILSPRQLGSSRACVFGSSEVKETPYGSLEILSTTFPLEREWEWKSFEKSVQSDNQRQPKVDLRKEMKWRSCSVFVTLSIKVETFFLLPLWLWLDTHRWVPSQNLDWLLEVFEVSS